MTIKALIFAICVLLLAACQPDLETIEVTLRPTLTATVLAMDTATSVGSPTPTATSTAVPPTPLPTATPEPTATPTPSLPSASVLFVRDNALQQWIPQTGEVKTLIENVTGVFAYSADKAVLRREITPEQENALIVFDIPTQSEYEFFRTSTASMMELFIGSVSISPNGRWLTYAVGDSRDSATLMVHEIVVEDQQVSVSPPFFTLMPGAGWNWPYDQVTWPTENELSWNDLDGIWAADLSANPIEPVVAIASSTNTHQVPSLNPPDSYNEPATMFTIYIPYLWSPDGRYLLVIELFLAEGQDSIFRVIERGTNKSFEIPESAIGAVSDGAVWLDKTTLVHYKNTGTVLIWQLDLESDPIMSLQDTIPAKVTSGVGTLFSFDNHLRFHVFYSLFDLNLETGELIQLAQDVPHWPPPYWSPDGQYVLWNDGQEHVLLDDLDGDEPEEMDSVFGLDSCCWHWYEE